MTKTQIQLELEALINLLSNNKAQNLLSSIKENLDYIRIGIVSIQHDLESTRRELKAAKKVM